MTLKRISPVVLVTHLNVRRISQNVFDHVLQHHVARQKGVYFCVLVSHLQLVHRLSQIEVLFYESIQFGNGLLVLFFDFSDR